MLVAELESRFTGDAKNFDQMADRVETRQRQIDGTITTVEVDANVAQALSKQDQVADEATRLEGLDPEVKVGADTTGAEEAFEDLGEKAEEAGDDGGKRSGKSMVAGIVGALATIPIAGALVGIAKAAGEAVVQGFQDGLAVEVRADRLAAATGLDDATVARLGAAAGEAYAQNFGESIEANMETARIAVQSGLLDPEATQRDAQQIIQSLSGVADILGEEIPAVTRAAQQLLRTGLAKDASAAFDIIVKGQQAGLNVSEDWLDTINEYGTQFRKLGLEGPEALGLLSQAVQAGARDTDVAADALKEFSIRAIDDSELTASGFEAIGLSAEEMSDKIAEGGPEATEALNETLDALREIEDPVKRNAAAVALFGTQAEDLGEALFAMDLDTAARKFNDLDGAAERALTTLGDNTAGKIASAQRNIEVAADGIKGALAEAFAPQIEGFAEFVSQNREAVVQFLFDAANGAIDLGRTLVEAAAAGTEGFGDFVGTTGPAVVEAINAIVQGLGRIGLVSDEEAQAFADFTEDAVKGMEDFDASTEVTADAIRRNLIENGLDPAQEKLNGLGEGLINNAALSDATNRLAEEIANVGYAADGSQVQIRLLDGQFDTSTKSGRLLDEQVRAVRDSLYDQARAAVANGESQKEVRQRVAQARDAFIDQMRAMGLTKAQAEALAREYGLIPKKVETEIRGDASQARQEGREAREFLNALQAKIKVAADTGSAYEQARAVQQYINGLNATITVRDRHVSSGLPGSRQGGNTRATGGPVWADQTYLVGEDGPELVRFAQAGTVIPAGQTAQILARPDNPAPASTTYAPVIHNHGDKVTEQTVVTALRRAELLKL